VILVTGATGNAGAAVVRALLGAGERVRGLVRREADRSRLPAGVEAVTGDLNEPGTLRAPLQDVRAVFLLSGHHDIPGALAEMRRAGVERVVLLSGSAAPDGDLSNAIARDHIVSERAVRESSGSGPHFVIVLAPACRPMGGRHLGDHV
jgi:uncharacterized protein YbjT (DUF2867 family)